MPPPVRPATPADAPAIARFNAAMALETEGLHLDPARLLAGVTRLLTDASKGFYIVAEIEGVLAGQLMITYEWSDWRNADFWWIQSVYVDPAHRRAGVFTVLYNEILRRARQSNACGLRLYVEHANTRAQQTYEKLGMSPAPYRAYEIDFVIDRKHD
ncbi:MAG: GNAT family N-acetyltransferase [Bryobacteraceae bacterium]